MSSPAYDTITDALKLEQFGHEDGDVVSSGTRVIIYWSYHDTLDYVSIYLSNCIVITSNTL